MRFIAKGLSNPHRYTGCLCKGLAIFYSVSNSLDEAKVDAPSSRFGWFRNICFIDSISIVTTDV